MKVAFILDRFPAYSETFLINRIHGVLEAGHDVTVFASGPRDEELVPEEYPRVERQARIVYLGNHYFALTDPVTWRHLMNRAVLPHRRIGELAEPYDVIYCAFAWSGHRLLNARRLGFFPSGKTIVSYHGSDLSAFLKKQGAQSYRRLFRGIDLSLPVCEYYGERLQALGCPPDRIMVLPSGIDFRHFENGTRTSRRGPMNLISVGRLVPKKGMDLVIRAVKAINEHGHPTTATIVGDGPESEALKRLAGELGVRERIRFPGFLPKEGVRREMYEADIFLGCYCRADDGDEDTMPNVMKEASATRLPIVCSNRSGNPELVQNEVNGLLFETGNIDALVAAVIRLIENPRLRLEMGRRGHALIRDRFDSRVINARLLDLMEKLTASGANVAA